MLQRTKKILKISSFLPQTPFRWLLWMVSIIIIALSLYGMVHVFMPQKQTSLPVIEALYEPIRVRPRGGLNNVPSYKIYEQLSRRPLQKKRQSQTKKRAPALAPKHAPVPPSSPAKKTPKKSFTQGRPPLKESSRQKKDPIEKLLYDLKNRQGSNPPTAKIV
jgi:hypothetical protein